MGKYNLIFKKNWFAKSIFGTVGIFVTLDQLARYQYNIPEIRDPNLTMWPWWLEKVNEKSGLSYKVGFPTRSLGFVCSYVLWEL
ncbi:hypothetical protein PGO_061040 [Plasmodium gonderi]|uniref:Uncharacterized protein n=1 Tax=Plasmodium gonderi TaxID=77519 RepID=A0A1Y1JCJ6_PLAGO|nr:hypothetical protein PGO_061040 [Plasmodium gonderi]GAW79960.1 hypothetical protein PGO_061040 [Plasmodium gonderi]